MSFARWLRPGREQPRKRAVHFRKKRNPAEPRRFRPRRGRREGRCRFSPAADHDPRIDAGPLHGGRQQLSPLLAEAGPRVLLGARGRRGGEQTRTSRRRDLETHLRMLSDRPPTRRATAMTGIQSSRTYGNWIASRALNLDDIEVRTGRSPARTQRLGWRASGTRVRASRGRPKTPLAELAAGARPAAGCGAAGSSGPPARRPPPGRTNRSSRCLCPLPSAGRPRADASDQAQWHEIPEEIRMVRRS